MDYDAHWQAFYDNMRAALDGAGFNAVPILAIHSTDSQTAEQTVEAPYVTYTSETQRNTGTMTGGGSTSGPAKVVKNGWRIAVRTEDLQDLLDISTALSDKFELEDIANTLDGYATTAVDVLGYQTLWEIDAKLHAAHYRVDWERSK